MNTHATTIIFSHIQINLLFIVSLNKLFRSVPNNKITPIILNAPHHIKQKKRETKLIDPLHIKHFIFILSHKLQSLLPVLNTSYHT